LTAREGQPDQIQLADNVKGEAGVGPCVEREGREVVSVVVDDFGKAVFGVGLESFTFAQHFAGYRIQRVVFHANERAAEQVYAIEDQPTWDRGLTAAEVAFSTTDSELAGVAAQDEGMPQSCCDPLEHRKVEVDGVPTGEDIRVQFTNAVTEGGERGALINTTNRFFRHGATAAVDDQHLVDAGAVHGEGQQAFGFRVRFDVERQNPGFYFDLGEG
jgi:hypothetical protein